MAHPNNPSIVQTNIPSYNGMYPDLNAQIPDPQQVTNYYTNQAQSFYTNPIQTVHPNYYQPSALYPSSQPIQTNYYSYPAPSQVPPSLYPAPITTPQPTQPYNVYTYTHPTNYLVPAPLPAPWTAPVSTPQPVVYTSTSAATQQLPLYPSSTSTQFPSYTVVDSSPKIEIPSNLSFEQTVQKSEELISADLQKLQSKLQSISAYTYETHLRETVAKEIVNKFAAQYREKFNKTGEIDLNQIKSNSLLLNRVLTANGNFYTLLNLNTLFLKEIFELGSENAPFEAVRKKILEGANPKSEKKPFSLLKIFESKEAKEKKAAELKQKKLEKVDLAEKEWNALNYVPTVDLTKTMPSAPAITPPSTPTYPPKMYPQIATSSIATPPSTLPPYGAPIENPQPAPEPAPIQPAQPIAGKKYSVDDDVPVKSYIDLAFTNLTWSNLPEQVRRDALLHVKYSPGVQGKAEATVLTIFKDLGTISQKLKYTRTFLSSNDEFSIKGQKLLDLYYSDKSGVFGEFKEGFEALPKPDRFYGYVYEMAKAANVEIADWDHDFAKHNWNKPGIFHLSIQALERCLHTNG